MVRKNRRNKRKLKSRRSRPINDVNHNNTNITIQFRKVLAVNLVATPNQTTYKAIRLAPSIAQITSDLGAIYKLYRFTKVKFTFQAELNQNLISDVAINYIPAQEALSSQPTSIEEFEGPAVGYFSNGRGTPYHYTVPSKVLNAMPYNWYETKGAESSDLVQGLLYILTNIPTESTIYVYAHFTCEFQTLEDPSFLTKLRTDQYFSKIDQSNERKHRYNVGEESGLHVSQSRPKQTAKKRIIVEEDDYDQVSIYNRTPRRSCDGL